MAGKSRTHSEGWWANNASPAILRCSGHYKSSGEQCRRVADDGAVVCDQHGAAAGQVRRRAAERIAVTADDAAQKLAAWMDDSSVPFQVRAKIAQDLLDRAGLGAAQVHKIMPINEDPVEALFRSILDDPEALLAPVSEPIALPPGPAPTDDERGALDALIGPPDLAAEIVRTPPTQTADKPSPGRNPTIPPKHIREALELL
ncbi:MAG: hypothetical protein JWO11_3909 [Nocardioides sp.]|nr:hypothetical protein [Nocardioides sp.]